MEANREKSQEPEKKKEKMRKLELSAFDLAQRFIGLHEVSGAVSNQMILAMLKLDQTWPTDDEVPWCSAFMNYICWLLRLPRSKNLRARSWLTIGQAIELDKAEVGFDVVVLKRGQDQPGPDVLNAPGHVGFFAGLSESVWLLGGNQQNAVRISAYSLVDVLGIRRLV